MKKLLQYEVWIVIAVAAIVMVAAGWKYGMARPMESDAYYYLQIAKNLGAGKGYVLTDGFWGEAPTMTRSPAWPFVVSVALRVVPGVTPDLVMRVLGLVLNVAVAGLLAGLCRRLRFGPWVTLVAGVVYVLHPAALHLAVTGASEMVFLALVLAGTLLLMGEGVRRSVVGCLVLGLATLARSNFLLWGVFAGLAALVLFWRAPQIVPWRRGVAMGALLFVLFVTPSLLWAARNQRVCGHFPVFSTLRGQTLYGGNNAVVGGTLALWGYWVFPNGIPGETPMVELAKGMSEYEVDCYYFARGLEYWRHEWFGLPRLFLGKLVRAYIPVPWKPSWGAYGLAVIRWGILIAGLCGLASAWAGLTRIFRGHLAAMFLTNVATVLMFWGCARFAFAVEPFLIPFAALAGVNAVARWRSGRNGDIDKRGGDGA